MVSFPQWTMKPEARVRRRVARGWGGAWAEVRGLSSQGCILAPTVSRTPACVSLGHSVPQPHRL